MINRQARVTQYVIIWLMFEVAIGGLSPLLFGALSYYTIVGGQLDGFARPEAIAGDLALVSTALAASRIPDLIESGRQSTRRTILVSLLLFTCLIGAFIATTFHSRGVVLNRAVVAAAVIMAVTLALGIWAQIERVNDYEAERAQLLAVPEASPSIKTSSITARAAFGAGVVVGLTLPRRRQKA
jgi:hypothetical protein